MVSNPFNSINFRNLAPICHECNSGHKGERDPLFGSAGKMGRRSVIFSFANGVAEIAVSVEFVEDLNSIRVASLEPSQFQVNLTCAEVEAAATWDAVFDVRRRYAGKICQKMSEWLQELCKEYRRRKGRMDVEQFFADKLEDFRDSPLASGNFLRYAIFSKLWSDGILAASMREMLAND